MTMLILGTSWEWAALSLPWFEDLGSRKNPPAHGSWAFPTLATAQEKLRIGGQYGVCELGPYPAGKAET